MSNQLAPPLQYEDVPLGDLFLALHVTLGKLFIFWSQFPFPVKLRSKSNSFQSPYKSKFLLIHQACPGEDGGFVKYTYAVPMHIYVILLKNKSWVFIIHIKRV